MGERAIRSLGLATAVAYAALIVWTYTRQPPTLAHLTGGLAASVGAYEADARAFAEGLAFFRADQFDEARSAFARADPAERDPRTQFYVAYSYYRQGWGRIYNDDRLFALGLEAVEKAVAASPGGRLQVEDADLQMQTADELRAELRRGLRREVSDFNPLRVLKERK